MPVKADSVCGWGAVQAVRGWRLRPERGGARLTAISLPRLQMPFH